MGLAVVVCLRGVRGRRRPASGTEARTGHPAASGIVCPRSASEVSLVPRSSFPCVLWSQPARVCPYGIVSCGSGGGPSSTADSPSCLSCPGDNSPPHHQPSRKVASPVSVPLLAGEHGQPPLFVCGIRVRERSVSLETAKPFGVSLRSWYSPSIAPDTLKCRIIQVVSCLLLASPRTSPRVRFFSAGSELRSRGLIWTFRLFTGCYPTKQRGTKVRTSWPQGSDARVSVAPSCRCFVVFVNREQR